MSYFSMPHAVRVDPNLSSHFMHRFGGVPIHKIMNPEYRNLRLHCLYILDMNDPCLPNITSTGKFLPLYYPLFNNACEFAYQIINDEEIVIHHLGQEEAELDFPYENYPQVLPEKALRHFKWGDGISC